jgi:NADP-dependent 3-hydroxy acid dehydrogenase YdfG
VQDLTQGHEDRALALSLDVTRKMTSGAVKEAESRFGSIDIL